ncbi:DUF1294 domain-containing protein [Metabacillus arenae]|uniref:DUF1294 domain-containing protein n=1 Tax=Metabacillus arenae TaxID=2771434 RepID=A0A926NFW8_9BACI|nr:DUF1294 domain-containing protein [Metabacillus arenae]MBD1380070.1 DUF1294 domain-containing protein [Metabacillus arenae]
MLWLWIFYILINSAGFLLMAADKRKAMKKQWRIKEQTIWITAIIGGAIGCTAGMFLFRHKTKHTSFRLGLPIIALPHLYIIINSLSSV